LLWPGPAAADPAQRWGALADIVFKHLSVEQGLPHTSVTALLEDRNGFIWVGTQGGLARWDGYRFRVYQPDPADPASLPDNYIASLYLDPQGQIWIGTNSGGLVRYDAARDQFVRIPVGPQGISHVAVSAILSDGADGLWVASRGGLDHFWPATGKVQQWHHDANDPASLPSNIVRNLARDQQGRLWIGTGAGLVVQDGAKFIPVPLPQQPKAVIFSLGLSQDGTLWVGTIGKGLFAVDTRTLQATLVAGPANSGLPQDTIYSILELGPAEIWLGTLGQGLVLLDSRSQQLRRLTHDASVATSLAANTVGAMLRDRSGLVWIGTHRGLNMYDPGQSGIISLFGNSGRSNGIRDTDVTAMTAMPDGSVWLGLLGQGINIIRPDSARVAWLHQDNSKPGSKPGSNPGLSLQGNRVYAISRPLNGKVYIGTDRGLFVSDPAGQQLQQVNLSPREPHLPVRALQQSASGLFVGGTDGLWHYDLTTPLQPQMRRLPGTEALDKRIIQVIETGQGARAGEVWIGTTDFGLYHYQRQRGSMQHYAPQAAVAGGLAHGNVANILLDSRGRIWAATQGGGLNLLVRAGAKPQWRRFGVAQGLPHDLVNKVLEDGHGQIWVSTDAGLAQLDPVRFTVRTLQRAEGVVVPAYWINSGTQSSQGELMFGGVGGITLVRPQPLRDWHYRAPVLVSSVQAGGKMLPPAPLNQNGPGLVLQPQANSLALEFTALDYSDPERNRYAYQLEGYDAAWINTDPSRRLAAYTNLPPGQYRLRLRGSNRNGEFNPQERVVPIRVLPAWHQSWWWPLLLAALVLGMVLVLVQFRTRYLRQRQLELEAQVQQRTMELQQKQAQLVEQEKLASLGSLVAGVAHEINTPVGTALMALSGAQSVWQRLAQAVQSGQLSKSVLQECLQEGGEYTTLALNANTRVADLVVSFKAIAVGAENEAPGLIDLQTYLDDLATLLCAPLLQAGGQVHIEVVPGLAVRTVCAALTEALSRILQNVLDHAFVGLADSIVPQIWLSASASANADGSVTLCVRDNGLGIDAQHRANVFEPFFTTQSGLGGHIGLGLYVAYNQITQRLKGEISIDPPSGQGCCVRIRLPAA
jgi:ligand-binding sensor domain-containing protein/signal transduction histidine kinase